MIYTFELSQACQCMQFWGKVRILFATASFLFAWFIWDFQLVSRTQLIRKILIVHVELMY